MCVRLTIFVRRAKIIVNSQCVGLGIFTQDVKCMCHIILASVSSSTVSYFSAFFHIISETAQLMVNILNLKCIFGYKYLFTCY